MTAILDSGGNILKKMPLEREKSRWDIRVLLNIECKGHLKPTKEEIC